MVGVELGNLDKTIAALIKLPVTSIAAKLRNAKSQKELKVMSWSDHGQIKQQPLKSSYTF